MGVATDAHTEAATKAQSTLVAASVRKHFGKVKANDGVDVTFKGGEVHGLLGENGAGKSTLIKCLTGVYRPDSGHFEVNGREVSFKNPVHSRQSGIAVVHQNSTLISRLSLIENVVLQEGRLGRITSNYAEQLVASGERLGFKVDPSARVETLSVGDRQRAEIARAFMHDAMFVILDEPTAVLSPAERESLFGLFTALTDRGIGIVFVTHHLSEALSQCTRTTVLRHGRVVGRLEEGHQVDEQELVRLIIGDAVDGEGPESAIPAGAGESLIRSPPAGASPGEGARVSVRSVSGAPSWGRRLFDISLEVRKGEVMGIAGVEGNGQREFSAMLTGAWRADEGEVTLDGEPLAEIPPRRRSELIGDVPDDHFLATCDSLSLWENLALSTFAWQEAPVPSGRSRHRRRAGELVDEFDIRTGSVNTPVNQLSGGNRRRVILARELCKHPILLVATYPTRGLDVRSAEQVIGYLRRLSAGGTSVVIFSMDLEEIIEVSDRVAVLSQGRITGILEADEISIVRIGSLMLTKAAAC